MEVWWFKCIKGITPLVNWPTCLVCISIYPWVQKLCMEQISHPSKKVYELGQTIRKQQGQEWTNNHKVGHSKKESSKPKLMCKKKRMDNLSFDLICTFFFIALTCCNSIKVSYSTTSSLYLRIMLYKVVIPTQIILFL